MFDRCVYFGLLFTSDDDLFRTLILLHHYLLIARSRETVFHVVPFRKSLSGTHMHLLFRRRFTSTDSYGQNSPRTNEE